MYCANCNAAQTAIQKSAIQAISSMRQNVQRVHGYNRHNQTDKFTATQIFVFVQRRKVIFLQIKFGFERRLAYKSRIGEELQRVERQQRLSN